ncbi:MAG: YceI family protein [Thermoanaerobaculia bacterium]|nr:YceI family protein [Thermoanaerobaculia bacterium]
MDASWALLLALLSVSWVFPASVEAEARTFRVDPVHSSVAFEIRHVVTKVPGRFREFEGTVRYDPEAPEASSVVFVVQADSIDTDDSERDAHLRSPDFFDVKRFPTLEFRSLRVRGIDDDTVEVTGELTIHGITREVTFPAEVLGVVALPGGGKAGFETEFSLNRKDYDITWNRLLDQGGAVLGDEVEVTIRLEADETPDS